MMKIIKQSVLRLFSNWLLVVGCQGLLLSENVLAADEIDSASRLKTLFTTPQERRKLDELRNSGQFDKQAQQAAGQPVIRDPLKVEVKGIVFREKHKPVVWVNQGNTLKSLKIEDGIRVSTSGVKKDKLKVPVRVFQQNLSMKPGQQWTETDRKVQDNYQIKRPEIKTDDTEMDAETSDNPQDIQ